MTDLPIQTCITIALDLLVIAYAISPKIVHWVVNNLKDWRTLVIFIIVCLVVSCEVWVMYILYFVTGLPLFLGIGSACWLFWLGPGTPFLPLCLGITIGIKSLWNKLRSKHTTNGGKRK